MTIRRQIDVFALFVIALLGLSLAQLGVGGASEPEVTPVQGDVRGYHTGIAGYFQVPISQVKESAASVAPLELPVVFFLARYSSTDPATILALRGDNTAWQEIAGQLGLGADAFYFPLAAAPDPAFGSAYDHFHSRPRSQWPGIRLSDSEIISLVNLRFLSEQSGERPGAVAELHAQGHDFVTIYEHLQQHTLQAEETLENPSDAVAG